MTGVNFNAAGLIHRVSVARCSPGHMLTNYVVPDASRERTGKAVNEMLDAVWGGGALHDDHFYKLCVEKLLEFGIDLAAIFRARGLDPATPLTAEQMRDLRTKDLGDLGEVLGYVIERDFRPVDERYIFAPNIIFKLKAASSLTGMDAMIPVVGSPADTFSPLRPDELLIICEWKHTSDDSTIVDPCRGIAESIGSITINKLFQELKRLEHFLRGKGETDRGLRTVLFLHAYASEREHIRFSSLILHRDSVSQRRAEKEVDKHLVAGAQKGPKFKADPVSIEAALLPVSDLDEFCSKCYEGYPPYDS